MALTTGMRLGPYEVVAPLGAGGMGEVYRARDTRLNREVALKLLPDEFAADQQRLTRFEREAQVLAALNHSNIAAIHGIERIDGKHFLVLELVPGETLSARVARGPVPLDETLLICRQIAEALEAAHEKGIIHRDLKPANVKITPDGKVKVLDFGLAKVAEPQATIDPSESPTISAAATRGGMILGTAAYMSPEQARGEPVDKRTDVWAFGCVMFEMLTGKRAFMGATVSDTLASLLKMEPEWNELPSETPPSIQRLLRRCLRKQPRERLHDIADARLEIEEALKPSEPAAPAADRTSARVWRWVAIALAVVIVALLWWRPWDNRSAGPGRVTRLDVSLPAGETIAALWRPAIALSPDGSKLAYVSSRSGVSQIYLRSMEQAAAVPLPGTENATGPFFSRDGQSLGFFTGRSIQTISLLGGTPREIAKVPPISCGADWDREGSIILSLMFGNTGLTRFSTGGEMTKLTSPNAQAGERSHCWPQVLPSGKDVIYTVVNSADISDWRIAVLHLESGKSETLVEGASMARYSPSGHLAYVRGGELIVVAFDPRQLKITGPPITVLENVRTLGNGAGHFTISDSGTLAFLSGGATLPERTLVWVDRQGNAEAIVNETRAFDAPRLSPDGRHIAMQIAAQNEDIWQLDISRGVLARVTTEDSRENLVVWCDNNRVVMASDRNRRPHDLFWKSADGTGSADALMKIDPKPYPQFPQDCADGKLLFVEDHVLTPVPGLSFTGWDILMVPLNGERKIVPIVQTPFDEDSADVSPDGRWLAYVSNGSGRYEVYVQPFGEPGGRVQISTEGGTEPRWSRNGSELFFRSEDNMMAVEISPGLRASRPRLLFQGPYVRTGHNPGYANYDVASDGRFVMVRSEKESGPTQINIVLNWFEELKTQATAPR